MDEFDKIQKLIRLKQYESPGEEFVDDFISKFRERQRAEMLKQSALSMFWEQVKMHFSEAPGQKWALATAAIAFMASAVWLAYPRLQSGPGAASIAKSNSYAGPPIVYSLANDPTGKTTPAFSIQGLRIMAEVEPDPGLLSKHFQSGFDQFIVVPHENSESTIAVPYELIRFEGRPDLR